MEEKLKIELEKEVNRYTCRDQFKIECLYNSPLKILCEFLNEQEFVLLYGAF